MCERRVSGLGFTLIELLVVVAIIGMLIAILLPSLTRARSQARDVKCRAQLREYARGFCFYFADYCDTFPACSYGLKPDDDVEPPTWFHLIESYWLGGLANRELSNQMGTELGLGRCPELRDIRRQNDREWEWEYSVKNLGYGYNRFWLGFDQFDREPPTDGNARWVFWRRLSEVLRPSECLLVADCQQRVSSRGKTFADNVTWQGMARVGGGVDTRHGASALPTVPSTYRDDTSYYL
ncbi:MAG: type II secretion system GspH family protein, partial [Planctomycetes bacterium]|nr:type II secretion system GspH family protein [Planctomycetota bacterium]